MASLNSRWIGPKRRVSNSPPRFTDREVGEIARKYREQDGWNKGARVTKR